MNTHLATAISAADIEKYNNPIPNRAFILDLLESRKTPLNSRQLANELKLCGDDEKEALRRRLRAMERDGQVAYEKRSGYAALRQDALFEGRVIAHRDGFGFVARDEGGDDLYMHNFQMRQLFDGDRVQVRVVGVDQRGRQEARLVKVLKRSTSQLVGRLLVDKNGCSLQPENSRIIHKIAVATDDLLGAIDGQYVVARITQYPSHRSGAVCQITEVLGNAMAAGMEIDVAIRNHGIPHQWPAEVIAAAKRMSTEVAEADKLNRVDLRALPFVTIDGEDARDFDDAVYCQPAINGGWQLFVAIADVSHYVQPDSVLDQEAQQRGTSVYFPGYVVPMLPESLSNGLCSLNPNVDRLVMVCEMRINNAGKMTAYQFSEGVIRSHARLTYNQVNALLNSPKSNLARKIRRRLADIEPHIQGLHQLYGALSQARKRRGALDFETQEVQFQFNTDKKIERIVPVQRNDAHRLIEECMLCANVATARFLQKLKLPALYRIHDGPQPKKLAALRAFLAEKGLQLGGGDKPTPAHYDRVLSGLDGRSDAQTIRTMMLRSLSQAEYNPENQGHFGLAYPAYAHFTSPIRRYPDLLVHRAIRSVIRAPENRRPLARTLEFLTGFGTKPINRVKGASVLEPGKSYPYDMPDLDTLADHCSTVSRRADKAAWDVDAWLKCEFMQARIGEMFDVVVSTATSFGLFAEIEQTRIEGLLHITELGQDHYHFDAVKQRLVEERSNTCFGPGDTLKVRVARVDMEQRRIEFELPKQKHKAPARKRNRRRSRKAAVQG